MEERIRRLEKGIVEQELPKLLIQPAKIEESIYAGATIRRELFITSANGISCKGLVYSSNPRVKVLNGTFGGLRNHIYYEVNARYLEHGDPIEGTFHLVTNSGEMKVPFSYGVELLASGQVLGGLRTPEDFMEIAKRDRTTALRLFEYQDFAEAPFMKDLHVRAIYDGMRGGVNRDNLLEEFLVALKVKEPVKVEIDDEEKVFENPLELTEDTILIRKENWGYLHLDVKADGDFLRLSKTSVQEEDFEGGRCEFRYWIRSDCLHRGRNFGSIIIASCRESVTIPIEAVGDETIEVGQEQDREWKGQIFQYLKQRLDFESGQFEDALILNRMQTAVDRMEPGEKDAVLRALLQAELHIMKGRTENAGLILDEWQDQVLAEREDQRELYCFYQYLLLQTAAREGQKDSLIRLLNKYHAAKDRRYVLHYLLLKLDYTLYENPGNLFSALKNQFKKGCCSPFLMLEACKILERNPILLKSLDVFETHVLYFGAGRELVGWELAMTAARLAGNVKKYHKLHYRLMKKLYGQFPERETLQAVCSILIKGNCRDKKYFEWYSKGVADGIGLTRLYEYYLYTLPEDFNEKLPKEVMLYFSYDSELDTESREVLYENVLKHWKPETEVYKTYERNIEQFTLNQMFESRINRRLAVMYKKMIYKEMVDLPVARVLPGILKSYRVICGNPNMRYVIVSHEEMIEEEAFVLKKGITHVPLFSRHSVLLFQDVFGNRYTNVEYVIESIMDEPELIERCFDVYPNHPMLRIEECTELLERPGLDESDVQTLEALLQDIPLHPLFEKKLLAKVIDYYRQLALKNTDEGMAASDYLVHLDKDLLNQQERREICQVLITQNYMRQAYEMVRDYGIEGIKTSKLLKLCARMILQNLFDQDETLLQLAFQVFLEAKADSVVLDYLCEHYNGTTEEMYRILAQAMRDHVEPYDMAERLLGQMMFTGATERIDQVFEWYLGRKNTENSVILAYFTIKCSAYFLDGQAVEPQVFAHLQSAVRQLSNKEKAPTIYLLALTRYFSTLPEMDGVQKSLCQTLIDILLAEGKIFPYYQKLGRQIRIPADIMDKAMISYRMPEGSKPYLKLRVLPDEDSFHSETMMFVYKNIYIKEKVLFAGEIMEYQIWDEKDGKKLLLYEGSVSCQGQEEGEGWNRVSKINEMGLCYNLKEEGRLRERMLEYAIRNQMAQKLFGLM